MYTYPIAITITGRGDYSGPYKTIMAVRGAWGAGGPHEMQWDTPAAAVGPGAARGAWGAWPWGGGGDMKMSRISYQKNIKKKLN